MYSELKGKGRERKKEENEMSLGVDWTVMEELKHISHFNKNKSV
jgi:hypothetical protein